MDFHILIVISCVFLASLCSLLFINKFFKRKTFEEIIAEKKAMSDRLNVQTRAAIKKPKQLQKLKKEAKREKKLRQKEQQRDNGSEIADESDSNPSVEEETPQGLSKVHVEFEPDPEIVSYNESAVRRGSNGADKENANNGKQQNKLKKDKKTTGAGKPGILVNKNEPVVVKETVAVIEEQANSFESKAPKDAVELKKQEKAPQVQQQQQLPAGGNNNKKEKNSLKKEKQTTEPAAVQEQPPVAKELRQQDEKQRQGSPKNQQSNNNNNKSNKQNKKQLKESTATKDLVMAVDKLSETDTIGVQLMMNLFRRAELNRSEIQILIDYLLNRQQDMPASHSEWSDDMCQKLKRQLEEKERLLAEEQEASIGIQAKLRELRTEINTERAQISANLKSFNEKMQAKDQDITNLQQELQNLNDKMNLERQQFQAKLVQAKQSGSQEIVSQLQLMQGELAHKDKYIGELTLIVNASRQAVEESQQKNDIIQNQLRALEQQREELEQVSNSRIFELEKAKTLETELAECKVELLNMQNQLESSKKDLCQSQQNSEAQHAQQTASHQKEIEQLKSKNLELEKQLAGISSQSSKDQNGLQLTLDAIKMELSAKEKQLAEFNNKNAELLKQQTTQQQELQKLVENLKSDVAGKQQQLEDVTKSVEQFGKREQELLQQLQEQKEKNNDVRMKNWKLIEALQNAETTLKQAKMQSKNSNVSLAQQQLLAQQKLSAASPAAGKQQDEQHVRALLQRLYPDAVKACAGNALSCSLDQWMEQVLATQVQQAVSKSNATASASTNTTSVSSSNKSTQHSNHSNAAHNSHNNSSSASPSADTNSSNGSSRVAADSSMANADVVKVHKENAQLRGQIDELTKLVKKTSNTLSDLEGYAREQDENWRSIVRSKDELIASLQHSNGEQNI